MAEAETRGLSGISVEEAKYLEHYCVVEPLTDMREIPAMILSEIDSLNKTIKLDSRLSENRDPDFLLLLMNQSGAQDLAWIIKLVEQNESFEKLPVQVLSEYAINIIHRKDDIKSRYSHLGRIPINYFYLVKIIIGGGYNVLKGSL